MAGLCVDCDVSRVETFKIRCPVSCGNVGVPFRAGALVQLFLIANRFPSIPKIQPFYESWLKPGENIRRCGLFFLKPALKPLTNVEARESAFCGQVSEGIFGDLAEAAVTVKLSKVSREQT